MLQGICLPLFVNTSSPLIRIVRCCCFWNVAIGQQHLVCTIFVLVFNAPWHAGSVVAPLWHYAMTHMGAMDRFYFHQDLTANRLWNNADREARTYSKAVSRRTGLPIMRVRYRFQSSDAGTKRRHQGLRNVFDQFDQRSNKSSRTPCRWISALFAAYAQCWRLAYYHDFAVCLTECFRTFQKIHTLLMRRCTCAGKRVSVFWKIAILLAVSFVSR